MNISENLAGLELNETGPSVEEVSGLKIAVEGCVGSLELPQKSTTHNSRAMVLST